MWCSPHPQRRGRGTRRNVRSRTRPRRRPHGRTGRRLAGDLEKAIEAELGVACRVVVLTSAELAKAVADNPYPDEPNPKLVHAFFLTAKASAEARTHVAQAQERAAAKGSRDGAAIVGRVLYLHTPDGFGRSELAAELSKGAKRNLAEGTARNWATVTKLLAMCEG